MCESPGVRFSTNLVGSVQKCMPTGGSVSYSEGQLSFEDEFGSVCSSDSQGIGCSGEAITGDGSYGNCPYRIQLEQDIQWLQQKLNEEMELHAALERAAGHAAIAFSSFPHLPHEAQELLSNIAMLEVTVSKLEEEMVSLHFQLSQERNERRLVEYHLKQPFSQSLLCSPRSVETLKVNTCNMHLQDKVSAKALHHVAVGKLAKQKSVKGLWNHPNQLSEEMVRCMKNIFICLANSSTVLSKSPALESLRSPVSPQGHLSASSLSSFSEATTIMSPVQSPHVELHCNSKVFAAENTFDPYRVCGKLSWGDIGSYGLAIEVSWMSVGKKQLEYAAGVLRRFRLLVEQLAKVNLAKLSCNEKLAFWINLYNALIMHAYLAYGVPRSELKLFSLMQKAAYTVGGYSFNAAAIEYVLLRMKPPVHRPQTALLLALHKLKISEEQRKYSVDAFEPLVAFALSCGMYSSPAVRIYSAENVREELLEAQRDFIRASVGVSGKGKLLVPKMLHCFARGFLDDDAKFAAWVSQFLPPQQASVVEECMAQRRQSFLGARSCAVLPFDSRFRYLFLRESMP